MSETETLRIAGMTFALCSLEIERKLLRLAGIERASVSYASERASIGFVPELSSLGRGFKKRYKNWASRRRTRTRPPPAPLPAERRLAKFRASLVAALVLSSPLFFHDGPHGLQGLPCGLRSRDRHRLGQILRAPFLYLRLPP